jgi:hypothetical protein
MSHLRANGRIIASMQRYLLIALLLVAGAADASAQSGTTSVVSSTTAEFTIPLPRPVPAAWKWNQATTSNNSLEYTWVVSVKNSGTTYEFGFFLYKYPGSSEKSGSLQALLGAGQKSVFEQDAEGRGTILSDARVDVSVVGGALVIRITEAALVMRIFRDRPASVIVRTRTPEATFETVPVTYRE